MSYEDFLELLNQFLPEHALVNEDLMLDGSDNVIELIQTGSVTIEVNGRKFELAISVTEVGK